MKILTGILKGQTISFKPNPHLRPTADKTRKAIFDMLQGNVEDRAVLDLFGGTGALGIEALSSGATSVVFVEIDKAQALAVKNNLEKLGLSKKSQVLNLDAFKAIEKLSNSGSKFDMVFIDPPYEKGLGQKAMTALANSGVINESALIILECRAPEDLPKDSGYFTMIKNKVYGDTRITIYRSIAAI